MLTHPLTVFILSFSVSLSLWGGQTVLSAQVSCIVSSAEIQKKAIMIN